MTFSQFKKRLTIVFPWIALAGIIIGLALHFAGVW